MEHGWLSAVVERSAFQWTCYIASVLTRLGKETAAEPGPGIREECQGGSRRAMYRLGVTHFEVATTITGRCLPVG
eukprot:72859-Chlamydomonas_euryale.AAC.7